MSRTDLRQRLLEVYNWSVVKANGAETPWNDGTGGLRRVRMDTTTSSLEGGVSPDGTTEGQAK